MLTPEQKANELIETFMDTCDESVVTEATAISYAIKCCNEVLGFMGADRGTAYWIEVLDILKKK